MGDQLSLLFTILTIEKLKLESFKYLKKESKNSLLMIKKNIDIEKIFATHKEFQNNENYQPINKTKYQINLLKFLLEKDQDDKYKKEFLLIKDSIVKNSSNYIGNFNKNIINLNELKLLKDKYEKCDSIEIIKSTKIEPISLEDFNEMQKKNKANSISPHFYPLQQMLSNGIPTHSLVGLLGRTSHGKSTFLLKIILEMCSEWKRYWDNDSHEYSWIKNPTPKKALWFALEETQIAITNKIVAQTCQITLDEIAKGLEGKNISKYENNKQYMSNDIEFLFDNNCPNHIDEIIEHINEAYEKGIKLFVIDHLFLLRGNSRNNSNSHQFWTSIVNKLQKLAISKEIIIFISLQASRASLQNKSNVENLQLQDIRESGTIEQNLNICIALNTQQEDKKDPYSPFITTIEVLKNRNGKTGKMEIEFKKQYANFTTHTSTKNKKGRK